MRWDMKRFSWIFALALGLCAWCVAWVSASDDLAQIRERGVLRHLSIPYANFNSGAGDGLSVDLMRLFSERIGVKYEYVETTWGDVIADLTGRKVKPVGDDVEMVGECDVRGDVIANGFTVLAWRSKAVAYSRPTFPTQVWLVAASSSALRPIAPGKSIEEDIAAVKGCVKGLVVLGKRGTCLDPKLYGIVELGGVEKDFPGGMNDLAPALLQGEADVLLLDVPDCLVALRKWPGAIKVIGPVSSRQEMACAFRRDSPQLREAFDAFLAQCRADGTYMRLIRKYYPDVVSYFPDFFADCKDGGESVAK